jgi:SAM-dependent methyltransferase
VKSIDQQIKSKQRVADHGEVFTSEREVNAMLDLVKSETERIDSRFLEPACGTGNFLAEVLRRKLLIVEKRYRRSQLDFEYNLIIAVSSLYGVDIQEDNVFACRERLFEIANEAYSCQFNKSATDSVRRVVRFILQKNIIWGDALSLRTPDNIKPIVFTEWSAIGNNKIKRRDFVFSELMPEDKAPSDTLDLFAEPELLSDLGEPVFIPKEIHSYPLVHFLQIGNEDD